MKNAESDNPTTLLLSSQNLLEVIVLAIS